MAKTFYTCLFKGVGLLSNQQLFVQKGTDHGAAVQTLAPTKCPEGASRPRSRPSRSTVVPAPRRGLLAWVVGAGANGTLGRDPTDFSAAGKFALFGMRSPSWPNW